jgi:RNA polymerase sigma factor (sigma-70 family)
VSQISPAPPNPLPSRLAPQRSGPADGAVAEFEALYRANVAITSFATFDPRKGTPRAWVFGIARRIYAAHCQARSQQRTGVERLAGRRELAPDEVGDLIDRIDAERAGRTLVTRLTTMPAADRAVVELVDLAGLQAKEAAQVLGIAPGTLRMRLMRARARLRTTASPDLAHGTDPASEPEVTA